MVKRILKRILISIVVLSTLTIIIVPITYHLWRVDTAKALASGSQLVETSKGTVEYARLGSSENPGNHLLILHGTPGGYDVYHPVTKTMGALWGYRLIPGSPCIDAGIIIRDNGGKGLLGAKLMTEKADIGAFGQRP